MAIADFEYQFWTVNQLRSLGLTPEFATSFDHFVRDVANIDSTSDGNVEQTRINAQNISTLQLEMSVVQVVSRNNSDRIDVLGDRVSETELSVTYTFNYLNGQEKPAEHDAGAFYSVNDYVTFNDIQYRCIATTNGDFNPDNWTRLGVVQNEMKISTHIDTRSSHGVTGDIVGSGDYCTDSTGGVVDLAASIAELTELDAPTTPAEEKINEIVQKINEIIAGQKLSKQMSGE